MNAQDVVRKAREANLRLVRFLYCDNGGIIRGKATHASKLGIQPHVIEAILNHVSGFRAGVAGIYNRNPYDAEKRTALALWADHLFAIVEDQESNVTPLRRA